MDDAATGSQIKLYLAGSEDAANEEKSRLHAAFSCRVLLPR